MFHVCSLSFAGGRCHGLVHVSFEAPAGERSWGRRTDLGPRLDGGLLDLGTSGRLRLTKMEVEVFHGRFPLFRGKPIFPSGVHAIHFLVGVY